MMKEAGSKKITFEENSREKVTSSIPDNQSDSNGHSSEAGHQAIANHIAASSDTMSSIAFLHWLEVDIRVWP